MQSRPPRLVGDLQESRAENSLPATRPGVPDPHRQGTRAAGVVRTPQHAARFSPGPVAMSNTGPLAGPHACLACASGMRFEQSVLEY
jgi:hypothetical protein